MSSIPEDLSYTKEHEWMRVSDGVATIGITDYAQDALTDVVWVELPMVGDHVRSMQAFASVESVKSVSEIYAPISGEVVEVNDELETTPEAINEDPYGGGWICKVRLESEESSKLLSAQQYRALIGE
tara:strand:- start:11213 stop:11593 length:381 start_codon:yes stop_codon:yes gene_type:complete